MAVKGLFILYRKQGMSQEQFESYWKGTHGPIAAKIPGMRKYVQNHIVPGSAEGKPPCDGVAEIYFDSPEALQAGLGSPAGKATLDDLPKFLDITRSGMFLVNEIKVV